MSNRTVGKPESTLLLEQDLLKLRVIETKDGKFDIEVAMLDGPSIGTTEPNELIAKTITHGLLTAYTEGLKELQDKMLKALAKIQDESLLEGESSESKLGT